MPDMVAPPFTIDEAAEASRMSKAWWRQAILKRKVRFIRIGRRVLIPRQTVSDLLIHGEVEPIEE